MQTATVSDLRHDYGKIQAWLDMGEDVLITKHPRSVARTVGKTTEKKKIKKPDYRARARKIFGDSIIPNIVLQEREESQW